MRELPGTGKGGVKGGGQPTEAALNAELRRSLHAAGNHLAALVLKGQQLQMRVPEGALAAEIDELVGLALETATAFERSRRIARTVCPLEGEQQGVMLGAASGAGPLDGRRQMPGSTAAREEEGVERGDESRLDEAPEQSSAAGLRVLVIDDDPSIRDILRDVLNGEGCPVDGAATAADGWALFVQHRHALVFTDLYLGAESGEDLAARIKGAAAATHVVLMTGWATDGKRHEGVDQVLPKPFRIGEIKALVRAVREVREVREEG